MMKNNNSCIATEIRTALYRRAIAEAYLSGCKAAGITLPYSLNGLQLLIAAEVESNYVTHHGAELGMEIVCNLLSDMVEPDLLEASPRLTAMGYKIMAELCGGPIGPFMPSPTLH